MIRTIQKFVLVICLLSFHNSHGMTLEERVAMLYEVSPNHKAAVAFSEELHAFCDELREFDRFSPKKRIKKVFGETRERYLHRYALSTFFPKIHKAGIYNCVTGSALLGIIFEELDIPYTVVEVPRHVYLVAYPNSAAIGVESTDEKGIYFWTEYNKVQAVSFLIEIGKVSDTEVKLKGIDAVIDEYFYSESELDFNNLVGLHFFNRALVLQDEKDFKGAMEMGKRSQELYPTNRVDYLIGGILVDLILNTPYEEVRLVDYLTRYHNLVQKQPDKDRALSTFKYIYQEALFARRDTNYTDTAKMCIHENLKRTKERDLYLSYAYLLDASWKASRERMAEALVDARMGYALNQTDYQFQELLTGLLIEELIENEPLADEFRDSIDSYSEKYPFVWETKKFGTLVLLFYTYEMEDAFLASKAEYGFEIMEELNAVMQKTGFTKDAETAHEVAMSYGQVAAYYYRKKAYKKALEWVNKGLKLYPDSESLLYKEEQIRLKL